MLSQNEIELAQIKWAAPIIFARNKHGSFHSYIEYTKLDNLTRMDSIPILGMDECIDYLGRGTVISTLDGISENWKVNLEGKDQNRTAFTSHHGLFSFGQMPFSLINAQETFGKIMDVILPSVG